ncbi:MAG: hypothetical protein NTY17_10870 [Planctomycetia bacterium]|nr:hypothetical protein [Planctomycetia bacterium]
MTDSSSDLDDIFAQLATTADAAGAAAMFDTLAASLKARGRWHALFDLRLLEARISLDLPATGELTGRGGEGDVSPADRDQLDERSLAACREVGWPLLEAGQVAAAWMYLRAAAAPAEVAEKLAALANGITASEGNLQNLDDEETASRLQEIVHVALWEGLDPALGIDLIIRTQGTCNSITAYEQAVSRLPARRQAPAAGVLVHHLHREVASALAADLTQRGAAVTAVDTSVASIIPLLDLLREIGGADDASIHVDVSHLQSVLRIARVCTDPDVIREAWELACYACRLPAEVVYPGEPPFENVGESSRMFFGAQLGHDVDRSIGFFRRSAAQARLEESGTLPSDTLVLLLTRLGRPGEALHAALERPAEGPMPSTMLASGMLPSLVELATAADSWDALLAVCRERGDEITFAATLAARKRAHQSR